MWIDTGMPRSAAARKNSSSAGDTSSPPAGHAVMMQPRAPISRQRFSSAIASWMPRFGIWARKNSRSGSAAQNSCAMKSLYARTPARWKSVSALPMK